MSEDATEQDDAGPPDETPPNGDRTTPRVDLALHGLTVSVTGRSEDELEVVESAARDLMDYLVEKNDELEEEPDEYGLS